MKFFVAIFLLLSACGVGEFEPPSILECADSTQDPRFCCPESLYQPVDPGAFNDTPGAMVGHKVAVRGSAAQFIDGAGVDPCTCVDGLCGCVTDLSIATEGCDGFPVNVPLGGNYGGQAVTCSGITCWPLTLGLPYTICGEWVYNPIQAQPGADPEKIYWLLIDDFCEG